MRNLYDSRIYNFSRLKRPRTLKATADVRVRQAGVRPAPPACSAGTRRRRAERFRARTGRAGQPIRPAGRQRPACANRVRAVRPATCGKSARFLHRHYTAPDCGGSERRDCERAPREGAGCQTLRRLAQRFRSAAGGATHAGPPNCRRARAASQACGRRRRQIARTAAATCGENGPHKARAEPPSSRQYHSFSVDAYSPPAFFIARARAADIRFFPPVRAFFSRRNLQAMRNAPASMSSFVSDNRI